MSEPEDKRYQETRRAYQDVFNRSTFLESRMGVSENRIQAIEKFLTDEIIKKQQQAIMLPPEEQDFRLEIREQDIPENLGDKSFSFVSLPLMYVFASIKNGFRAIRDLFSPDVRPEAIALTLQEARRERELIIVMKIQKVIAGLTRSLASHIRKNREGMIYEVGDHTNDMIYIANAAAHHMNGLGYDTEITINANKIYLHINIDY